MNKVSQDFKEKMRNSNGTFNNWAESMKANSKELIKTSIFYRNKTNN